MSNKNNVNKDFYTIAGRDRPNEDLVIKAARSTPAEEAWRPDGKQPNFIPGAPPVGETAAKPAAPTRGGGAAKEKKPGGGPRRAKAAPPTSARRPGRRAA